MEKGPTNIIQSDMKNLYIKDLIILKQFLEKALRDKFLLACEEKSAHELHTKLKNIIDEVIANQLISQ